MVQVTLEEASAQLSRLIRDANTGEEVIITQDNHPVARLVGVPDDAPRLPRKPGTARHLILYMADDFDSTPEGFEEYMP